MSRSLGDNCLKPEIVPPTPDVQTLFFHKFSVKSFTSNMILMLNNVFCIVNNRLHVMIINGSRNQSIRSCSLPLMAFGNSWKPAKSLNTA